MLFRSQVSVGCYSYSDRSGYRPVYCKGNWDCSSLGNEGHNGFVPFEYSPPYNGGGPDLLQLIKPELSYCTDASAQLTFSEVGINETVFVIDSLIYAYRE